MLVSCPWVFFEAKSSATLISHSLLDCVNYGFPQGWSMSKIAESQRAMAVGAFQRMELAALRAHARWRLLQPPIGEHAPMAEQRQAEGQKPGQPSMTTYTRSTLQGDSAEAEEKRRAAPDVTTFTKSPASTSVSARQLRQAYVTSAEPRMLLQKRTIASRVALVIAVDHVNYPSKFVKEDKGRPYNVSPHAVHT
jgi:hypothetical protein